MLQFAATYNFSMNFQDSVRPSTKKAAAAANPSTNRIQTYHLTLKDEKPDNGRPKDNKTIAQTNAMMVNVTLRR
ncbi:unnamed protein product [Alternaria alternata]